MNARALEERGWPCPTGEEMARVDRHAIEALGIPGRVLMESAGRAVASAILERFPQVRAPLVVCGGGNNGGDGFVVARVLADRDDRIRPVVLALGDPARASEETRANLGLLSHVGVEVVAGGKEIAPLLEACDLVVDAVFGVGLARPIEGPVGSVLRALVRSSVPVVSVDLPSGLSSETGAPLGVALDPALTVTLGLPKLGLALAPLRGEVWVADIGLPWSAVERAAIRQHAATPSSVARLLPARPAAGHKGSFGHVLVVVGSQGKTGAGALACEGALRAGAGLVTAAVPASLLGAFEAKLLEAMSLPLPDAGRAALGPEALPELERAAASRQALVVGPGLGARAETVEALLGLLSRLRIPAVVDADGLNAFAGRPEALRGPGPRVLTPHPGEMGRLLGRDSAAVQADRAGAARALAAASGAVVVLKGARTVIAASDGELHVNPTGGPGLATGGTGDVLAGVIGGLLAQGLGAREAAVAGAWLHGRAGDLGPSAGGLAGEVAARVPQALAELRGVLPREGRGNGLHRFR